MRGFPLVGSSREELEAGRDDQEAGDSEHRLAALPNEVRNRLNGTPLHTLIKEIEKYGFECEGGPLTNTIQWLELKARIAHLSRLIPRPESQSR